MSPLILVMTSERHHSIFLMFYSADNVEEQQTDEMTLFQVPFWGHSIPDTMSYWHPLLQGT